MVAPADGCPRYRTSATMATMVATTKRIMNTSITQPPAPAPEPQYPSFHIIMAVTSSWIHLPPAVCSGGMKPR